MLNTDGLQYGGSGVGNLGGIEAAHAPLFDFPCSAKLTLPPLAVVFFRAPDEPGDTAR